MAITTRSFDEMVESIMARIIAANIGITDNSKGSVIRTLTESIVAEIDIQYFQMIQAYTAICLDDATGTDVDRLVVVLGVTRNQATSATGIVRFSKTTPAVGDIPIQVGTIVSTKVAGDGTSKEFITTSESTLLDGETYVDVAVSATLPGSIYLPPNSLTIMSTPIIGIDSITNQTAIVGGSDIESDENLKLRSKLEISKLGKGTATALEGAIREVDGVIDVKILDMNRGAGTTDVIIVGTSNPPDPSVVAEVESVILTTKAAGIDVGIIYPTIVTVDITITTTNISDSDAGLAILEYLDTLGVGDTFILRQMESRVLQSTEDPDADMVTTIPIANVIATSAQIIRAGTITINGVVYG